MSESASKPTGVSWPVLVLSLLLAVAVTAAAMLAIRPGLSPLANADGQASGARTPEPGAAASAPVQPSPIEPINQTDKVNPGDHATGQVYYAIPFASPPHLKLTAVGREYEIANQDELGFVWFARLKMDDFDIPKGVDPSKVKDLMNLSLTTAKASFETFSLKNVFMNLGDVGTIKPKPDLVFEEFTWEAKGIRGKALPASYVQRGSFSVQPNTTGEVIFKVPYAQPAHLELMGNQYTSVTECRANGFKWKNVVAKDWEFAAGGTIQYVATGQR